MRGTYGRRLCPEEGKLYVAGVDIAGRVLEDGRPILNDRDETVVTIAEVRGSLEQPVTRPRHHGRRVKTRTAPAP